MNYIYVSLFALATITIGWWCTLDKDLKQTDDNRQFIVTDNGIRANQPLTYSAEVYGSVGYWFKIEYDSTAFHMTSRMRYYDPEAMETGKCGGDEGELTYILTPKKKGDFIIYETKGFRRETVSRTEHRISVR